MRLLPPQTEASQEKAKKKQKRMLTVADTLAPPSPKAAEEKTNGDSAGVWSVKIKCKDLPGCTRHPISSVVHTQHQHAAVEVSGATGVKPDSEADPPGGDGEQKTEHEPPLAGLSRLRDQVAKDHELLKAKLREVEAVLSQARPQESSVIGDEDGWCLIRVQAEGACRVPAGRICETFLLFIYRC